MAMAKRKSVALDWTAIGFGILLVVSVIPAGILQDKGYTSDEWLLRPDCKNIGLWRKCCSGYDKKGTCNGTLVEDDFYAVDVTVYEMERFSAYVYWGTLIGLIYICYGAELGICCLAVGLILYPVAGLVSFSGCMILLGRYDKAELGPSFYQCLASGIISLTISSLALFVAVIRLIYKYCACDFKCCRPSYVLFRSQKCQCQCQCGKAKQDKVPFIT